MVFSFLFVSFLVNAHALRTCDLLFSLESLFLAIKHVNVSCPITVMADRLVAPGRAFLMSVMRQTLTVSSLVRSTANQPDHFITFFACMQDKLSLICWSPCSCIALSSMPSVDSCFSYHIALVHDSIFTHAAQLMCMLSS